jgi:hypothetical protein
VHPYPTRFHGAIYTRPVFGFQENKPGSTIARTQSVMTPGYNLNVNRPQPTLSGLGVTEGEEGMLWDTGNGVFKPGGYGGGVFDGDISGLGSIGARKVGARKKWARSVRGLGDDSADYPWRTYSDKTKALQQATNASLAKAGMCPLAVDGKLGGATCGARNYLTVNSQQIFGQEMSFANPSACDAHSGELVRPKSSAGGCGGGGVITPAPSTLPQPALEAGMSSSTKRALGFALGGVLAIGAVVMMRKKHG